MSSPGTSAWDRQRTALRKEIVETARGIFIERGFDAVTVDDIVSAVGISRRSFFRYFGTKEDVLLTDLAGRGEAIAAALAARPIKEDPWTALIGALSEVRKTDATDTAANLALGRMILHTPSLHARHLEKRLGWHELLVPLVELRLHGPSRSLRATAIVATILSCLDAATDFFVLADGETSLDEEFRTALEAAALSAPPGFLDGPGI